MLDIGCGTGMVGVEIRRLGAAVVDGIDISPEVLAEAAAKHDDRGLVYRNLVEADLSVNPELPNHPYTGVVSAGTFTHGHLGPESLIRLVDLTGSGTRFTIGVNEAHFVERGFERHLRELERVDSIGPIEMVRVPIYETSDASEPQPLGAGPGVHRPLIGLVRPRPADRSRVRRRVQIPERRALQAGTAASSAGASELDGDCGRAARLVMTLQYLRRDEATAEVIAETLRRDGAVVVEDLIDAATVSAISDGFKPYLEAKQHGTDRFEGKATKRLGSLIDRVPSVHPLVTNPLVVGAADDLFSDATAVQLNATQVVAISSGEQRQPLHRDQWAWDHFPWPIGYEVELSTMWAFTDFTAANGATRVALGSHRTEGRPRFEESDLSLAEMAAGSTLFYTGSVMHGAGANTTADTRVGMIVSYTRGWLRQHENQYLCVPLETAKQLPEPLQRLIGYSRGAYAIGYWGDMDDPIEAVRPGAGTAGLGGSLDVPIRSD